MFRRVTFILCLLTLSLTSTASAKQPGFSSVSTHTYEVKQMRATWVVPWRKGDSRLYRLETARYEDMESHKVLLFARAEWLNCYTAGSCGGGTEDFEYRRGTPTLFEFADDMSRGRVLFSAHRKKYWAKWRAVDALSRPFEFLPGTAEYYEGCDGGEGSGNGVYRRMEAEGFLFGRSFDFKRNGGFTSLARYVLTTECDPRDWWKS
jgi:hypothetical protein